jgi:hypothetical protein
VEAECFAARVPLAVPGGSVERRVPAPVEQNPSPLEGRADFLADVRGGSRKGARRRREDRGGECRKKTRARCMNPTLWCNRDRGRALLGGTDIRRPARCGVHRPIARARPITAPCADRSPRWARWVWLP